MNARDVSMNARRRRWFDWEKTTKGYPNSLKKGIRHCWAIM